MSEAGILRLENIYGAIYSILFDAMKVRLQIKKKVDIVATPELLSDIFKKLHQRLNKPNGDSTHWLLPSKSQP